MNEINTVAAIDCGTNSIRLLISRGGTEIIREMEIVKLGEGVDRTQNFSEAAVARTLNALEKYKKLIDQHKVTKVRFCATSATRDAKNREIFTKPAAKIIGVLPEVIVGTEEAALSFLGATAELPRDLAPFLVVDIGGGSTEFVFGGDDVTFVCNGRIGLWAAQVFLDAFSEQTLVDETGRQHPAHAAAGVAIVKVRYPFARAYELSEQLCKNAKTVFERKETALDWHIAQSGLFGDLAEIRQREYQEMQKGKQVQHSLLMRPLTLQPSATAWRTWDNFVHLTRTFQDREQWSRNKVLDLRDALRAGENTVRQFVINYERNISEQALPALPTINDHRYRNTGWYDDRAVYFDAIEMIDQLLPAAMAKEVQS